jgi:ABC-2 type transport system permease protein
MSTTTLPSAPHPLTARLDRSALRLTTPRVIRSEIIKLVTARSTWFLGIAAVAVMVGIAALASGSGAAAALAGSTFAAVLLGAYGAVCGAREFGTGLVRTTLSAVPRRGTLVTAKVVALLVVVVPVAALAVVGAVAVGSGTAVLTAPATLGVLAANVAYLAGVAVIGLALGLLLRSSAGAVSATIGIFFVLPMIATLALPAGWADLGHYLPSAAGGALTSIGQTVEGLSPTAGGLVFLAWVVTAVASAVLALTRRDA